MASITDYGQTLVKVLFNLAAPPSTWYVGLLSTDAGPAADGSSAALLEPPSTAGYHRIAVANGPAQWSYDGDNAVNVNDVVFPVATDTWGQVGAYALFDAAGDIYGSGDLPTALFIEAGMQPVLTAGSIQVGFLLPNDDNTN